MNSHLHKPIIKVCGMREAENIRQVEALGVDMMGFIFWSGSSRYVSSFPSYLPDSALRVGVFVDEEVERVVSLAKTYALDYIQLHGHESPDYCARLKDYRLIKAFSISSPSDLASVAEYEDMVELFLFDTKGKSVGGNGEKFDWNVLSAYEGRVPFLLSGGIAPDDVSQILAFHYPKCVGFDLNSRFEVSPALKDIDKLNFFLQSIRQ